MKCPNCGSESQGKFCKYCGTPLTQETQQQKNYEEQDGPAVENMSGEQKESGEGGRKIFCVYGENFL